MEGLPLLPGFSFKDPTQNSFHVSHVFDYKNGYGMPLQPDFGIGKRPLDVNSVAYYKKSDPVRYDPSLTYGRTKPTSITVFMPHFVKYDKKCLTFFAFFRQSVHDSQHENFRIRHVNIIYFIDDDTITVMEPTVRDSGIPQGRLITRSRIPKSTSGDFYHWKDLNLGIDIAMFGTVYHICSCDAYTREYLLSEGIELNAPEAIPADPYIRNRELANMPAEYKTPSSVNDKLRRFLEFDGRVLRFFVAWDDRESEYGEMRPFVLRYYLSDDRIDVSEVKQENSGRDAYPLLIGKMKLPRNWKHLPMDYPAGYLEKSDVDVVEYYQPKDLVIGNTLYLMARRFLIYDCDDFTRKYYKGCLNMEQPPAMQLELFERKEPPPKPAPPPHIGIGMPDDTLQSCYSVIPRPPRQDIQKYILNAGRRLRYSVSLISVHPEDEGRQFVMEYDLGEGKTGISELPVRNSGFVGGRFLNPTLLPKPGTDKDNPEYYTPLDFGLGAEINAYSHRFVINDADLKVYRYMEANPEKFTPEMLSEYRNHFLKLGFLKRDVDVRVEEQIRKEGCL